MPWIDFHNCMFCTSQASHANVVPVDKYAEDIRFLKEQVAELMKIVLTTGGDPRHSREWNTALYPRFSIWVYPLATFTVMLDPPSPITEANFWFSQYDVISIWRGRTPLSEYWKMYSPLSVILRGPAHIPQDPSSLTWQKTIPRWKKSLDAL